MSDYPGLIEAATAYLADRPSVDEAVFAVATPVRGDEIRFTNSPWRFSISEAKRALGLSRLSVINDFAAQAEAVSVLNTTDLCELKAGPRQPNRPILVIGPGTGLGAAFLVPDNSRWKVVPSEAGHASFAPENDLQATLLAQLRRRYGHVSFERLLSGPGLLSITLLIAELEGVSLNVVSPREVSARAAEGSCPYCAEAVHIFSSILGAAAGNLALTLLTDGGIFITGGLCRGLGPLLDVAALNQNFTDKGRFSEYVAGIRIDQVLRAHTGLLGAAIHEPDR